MGLRRGDLITLRTLRQDAVRRTDTFARGTLTKHVLNGRTLVDATELEPLMFEPSSEAPRPARAAPLPLSLNQSVPHASRRLRADDEHHRRRVEHLLEDLLDELRSLRTSLLTHGRARP